MFKDFLIGHWLRLHASTAGNAGSVPGWETKIPHASWYGQKKKKFLMYQYIFFKMFVYEVSEVVKITKTECKKEGKLVFNRHRI